MKKCFYLFIISIISFLLLSNILFAENDTFYITQSDFDSAVDSQGPVNGISYNSSNGFILTSGKYILNGDINIDNVYVGLYIKNDVSIDLNNHDITFGNNMFYPLYIAGGNLVINGEGQINGSSVNVLKSNFGEDSPYGDMIMQYANKLSILMGPSGTLEINGGVYNGTVMNFLGEVTINDGTFYDEKVAFASGANVTVNGGQFTGLMAGAAISDGVELEINGGTFIGGVTGLVFRHVKYNFLPVISLSGGLFKTIDNNGLGAIGFINEELGESEFKNVLNSYLKTGYKYNEDVEYGYTTIDGIGNLEFTQKEISVEEESINTYTITQADFDAAKESYDYTTHIGETVKGITYYDDLDFNYFVFSNGTYTLGSDIEISSGYFAGFYIDNNVTINLNNHNITFDDDMYMPIAIFGGHLIINGEGQIYGSRVNYLRNNNGSSVVHNVKEFTNKVSIIVTENGNLEINGGVYNGSIIVYDGDSTITINNGTFYDEKVAVLSGGNTIINDGQFTGSLAGLSIGENGTLVINDGTFIGNDFALAIYDYSIINSSISGGTFKSIGENGYGAIVFKSGEMDEKDFDTICDNLLKSGYKYDEIVQYYYSLWDKNEGIGSVIYTQKELNVVLSNNEYKIRTIVKNGNITPSSYISGGNNFTALYEANNGYTLKKVIVDGVEIDKDAYSSSYTFNNVSNDHVIEVTFVLDQNNNGVPDDEEYLITTSVTNGTITPSAYIYSGNNFTVSYEANNGYIIKSVIVDGVEIDKDAYSSSYTFNNVDSEHTIDVVYSTDQNNNNIPDDEEFLITTSVINGTITESTYVYIGEEFTIYYKANTGYTLKSITIDGQEINRDTHDSSYTFDNVNTVYTLEVVFALDTNNNNIPDDEEYLIETSVVNGTITKSEYLYDEEDYFVEYEPNEGYILKSVTVDGEKVDIEEYHSNYTFVNDQSNHTIVVIYSLDSNNNGIPDEDELKIIAGENQTYEKGKDIVITINGEVDLFVKLLIDGKEVNKKNYSVKSGSTIITIKSKYLDSLSAGVHTITFVYQNSEISTTLNIVDNPYTFDNIYNYCILLAISLLSLVGSIFKYKQLYKNN